MLGSLQKSLLELFKHLYGFLKDKVDDNSDALKDKSAFDVIVWLIKLLLFYIRQETMQESWIMIEQTKVACFCQ